MAAIIAQITRQNRNGSAAFWQDILYMSCTEIKKISYIGTLKVAGRKAGKQGGRLANRDTGRRKGRKADKLAGRQANRETDWRTGRTYLNTAVMLADGQVGR
jgi:hypothetical protein